MKKSPQYLAAEQAAFEHQKAMNKIGNWLSEKLQLNSVNAFRKRLDPNDHHKHMASLMVQNAHYDEGTDLGSNPEDEGFHIEFTFHNWNGPLNVPGIQERSKKILDDQFGRAYATKYYVVIKDELLNNELKGMYLAQAWKASVKAEKRRK